MKNLKFMDLLALYVACSHSDFEDIHGCYFSITLREGSRPSEILPVDIAGDYSSR